MKSISADPEGSFLLITNENVEVFDFDPQQTFMIAYAIDDLHIPYICVSSLFYLTAYTLQCYISTTNKE